MKITRYLDFISERINRDDIKIKTGLTDEEFKKGCELCATILSEELEIPSEDIFNDIYEKSSKEISSIAIDINTNDIIGSVICKETTLKDIINSYENPEVDYLSDDRVSEDEVSIEGAALSVKEEYRNSFVVFKLLNNILTLGYKYIYIQQFESLQSNINYIRKGCKELINIKTTEYDEPIKVYVYKNTTLK